MKNCITTSYFCSILGYQKMSAQLSVKIEHVYRPCKIAISTRKQRYPHKQLYDIQCCGSIIFRVFIQCCGSTLFVLYPVLWIHLFCVISSVVDPPFFVLYPVLWIHPFLSYIQCCESTLFYIISSVVDPPFFVLYPVL